jgi:hypothetical protein
MIHLSVDRLWIAFLFWIAVAFASGIHRGRVYERNHPKH